MYTEEIMIFVKNGSFFTIAHSDGLFNRLAVRQIHEYNANWSFCILCKS